MCQKKDSYSFKAQFSPISIQCEIHHEGSPKIPTPPPSYTSSCRSLIYILQCHWGAHQWPWRGIEKQRWRSKKATTIIIAHYKAVFQHPRTLCFQSAEYKELIPIWLQTQAGWARCSVQWFRASKNNHLSIFGDTKSPWKGVH